MSRVSPVPAPPGAKSERNVPTLEKYDTTLFLSTDPTLMADEMQAGEFIPLVALSFPEAATVAILTERS